MNDTIRQYFREKNDIISQYLRDNARKGGLKARNQSDAAKASWSKAARIKRKANKALTAATIGSNKG